MNRLIAATVMIALLALGGWALWARGEAAMARAELAEQQRDAALARERQKGTVIDALRTSAATLEAQRQAAAETQAALERTASDRLTLIETLQHENEALRSWAESRLPDAVVRMRQRPAVTGADAYRQAMRNAEPLHPAGEPSDDQRRTESAARAH